MFRVLLADPPWHFKVYREGSPKSATAQYDCMSLDDLCAYRSTFDHLLAADCVLVMWTTGPMMAAGHAHTVMRAWGFTPKTAGAWGKLSSTGRKIAFGTGYIYRGAAEFWLLGTRGHPRARSRSVRNFMLQPTREHSRKPDQMYVDLEELFEGPYLELFARQRREGWSAIGDEVDKFSAAIDYISVDNLPTTIETIDLIDIADEIAATSQATGGLPSARLRTAYK